MRPFSFTTFAAFTVLLVSSCLGFPGTGQARELGPEFTVSTTAEHYALASDAKGGFLVAWTEEEGGTTRLFARLYAANRRPLGGVKSLGLAHGGETELLAVTAIAESTYVVAWSRATGGAEHLVARRVAAGGIGGIRGLGAAPSGSGGGVAIAALGAARWASAVTYPRATAGFGFGGIWLTLRSASGLAEQSRQVTRSGFAPALSADGTGKLLVAYRGARPGEPETMSAQLVDAEARRLAAAEVTSTDFDIASNALLAADGRGRFVVGWVEQQSLRLRFFEPPMRAVTTAFDTGVEGSGATVAMDSVGHVLAAASSAGEFNAMPILARTFDRYGVPTDDVFEVANGNGPPVAAALGTGCFVVVYRQGDALRARLVRP